MTDRGPTRRSAELALAPETGGALQYALHACSVPRAGVRRLINEISDHSRPSPENNASLAGESRTASAIRAETVRSDA